MRRVQRVTQCTVLTAYTELQPSSCSLTSNLYPNVISIARRGGTHLLYLGGGWLSQHVHAQVQSRQAAQTGGRGRGGEGEGGRRGGRGEGGRGVGT